MKSPEKQEVGVLELSSRVNAFHHHLISLAYLSYKRTLDSNLQSNNISHL